MKYGITADFILFLIVFSFAFLIVFLGDHSCPF